MKKQILLGVLVVAMAGLAQATLYTYDSGAQTTAIADGNAVGITESTAFATGDANLINNVQVNLTISGGYNGDLYGYLVYQSGGTVQTAILLNRVGTSSGDPFGSSGSGFNVQLSDSGAGGDIHNATGLPSGAFQSDQYAGANSLNTTFGSSSVDGTWTLFLADLSAGGGTAQLTDWGLNISVVPEPITWAVILLGVLMGLVLSMRYRSYLQHYLQQLVNIFVAWVDAV